VAVQKIANSNTLDCLREQSNVGTRMMTMFVERLIDLDYQGKLDIKPGLATEWRRIDDRTVEFKLRPGVKLHNGDEFSGRGRGRQLFRAAHVRRHPPDRAGQDAAADRQIVTTMASKDLPREIPPVAAPPVPAFDKSGDRRPPHRPHRQRHARRDDRGPHVRLRRRHGVRARVQRGGDLARLCAKTGRHRAVPYPRVQGRHLATMDAHDEYWGGRPPVKTLRLVEVPEVSSRVNGLLAGEFQFACDMPPDQISAIEKNAAFEVQGGTIPNHRITTFDKNHAPLRDPRPGRGELGHFQSAMNMSP